MSKRVYISADYSLENGDRDVVNVLNQWGADNLHKVDFIDMSKVVQVAFPMILIVALVT